MMGSCARVIWRYFLKRLRIEVPEHPIHGSTIRVLYSYGGGNIRAILVDPPE